MHELFIKIHAQNAHALNAHISSRPREYVARVRVAHETRVPTHALNGKEREFISKYNNKTLFTVHPFIDKRNFPMEVKCSKGYKYFRENLRVEPRSNSHLTLNTSNRMIDVKLMGRLY